MAVLVTNNVERAVIEMAKCTAIIVTRSFPPDALFIDAHLRNHWQDTAAILCKMDGSRDYQMVHCHAALDAFSEAAAEAGVKWWEHR